MAVAIQLVPERFKESEQGLLNQLSRNNQGDNHVRRPTRGIQLKEETFATLRVVANNSNSPVPLIDAGSRRKNGDQEYFQVGNKRATDIYSNFFLQQVQEDRMEKQQILETFGEPYIFLFGERARMMTFQGVLLNTDDFNWEAEWWENYEQFLRGTRCVESDARVFLSFDETLVSGYIIGCSASKSAQERNYVNFQFQMFVTSYSNFSRLGNPHVETGDFMGVNPLSSIGRPTLLTPNEEVFRQLNYKSSDKTLLEGVLETGVKAIANVWNKASQITQSVVGAAGNILNGEVVRVPEGFQGALVFDDDIIEVQDANANWGAIKYTTYSDNNDEYVGRSSHYGSSVGDSGLVRYNFEEIDPTTGGISMKRDMALVQKANDQWRKNGFSLPSGHFGPVTAALIKTGIGMVMAGPSAAWRLVKPVEEVLGPAEAGAIGRAIGGRKGGSPNIEG